MTDLGTDLVAALSSLNMNYFSHDDSRSTQAHSWLPTSQLNTHTHTQRTSNSRTATNSRTPRCSLLATRPSRHRRHRRRALKRGWMGGRPPAASGVPGRCLSRWRELTHSQRSAVADEVAHVASDTAAGDADCSNERAESLHLVAATFRVETSHMAAAAVRTALWL